MLCPKCNEEMQEGTIESRNSLLNPMAIHYFDFLPKGTEKKLINKDKVPLEGSGNGYYCKKCKKIYAEFTPYYE